MNNKIKQDIEAFKKEISFPKIQVPDEIENILNYNRQTLLIRNIEDLAVDSVQLSQYSLYLKTQYNRYRATVGWCEANINSIVGREISNTQGYGLQEKKLQIVRNDKDANFLDDMKTFAETKVKLLEEIDRKLEFMANAIRNLIFAKKQEKP